MAALNGLNKGCLLVLSLLLFISSCARHVTAPISDRQVVGPDIVTTHVVSSGETLYSIAWRFGLEHRKLAAVNGIRAPYTIFPGQRLNLDTSKAGTHKVATAPTPKASKPTSTKPVSKPAPKPIARKPQTPKPAANPQPVTRKPVTPKNWRWQWPVTGRLVRYYDVNKRFKGVYLQAPQGRAVKAAAPGEVVYAGNGLHSYGPSIIIKHSDVYLSFYALNRKLLVKEGDRVSGGQKIAEVGGDLSNRNRIYFEIRRDGQSTDPIRLLPKR
ncbi:peptidoglycan DD-metalloendopeptidase family protein [bacterium SCSIO 12696]|nr:peptidoglycan DD-metalloendopeptidase family protein [bacterium SCSIO 12696]